MEPLTQISNFVDEMHEALSGENREVAYSPISAYFMMYMVNSMMKANWSTKGKVWPMNDEYKKAFVLMRKNLDMENEKDITEPYRRYESMVWMSPVVDAKKIRDLCADFWHCYAEKTMFADSLDKVKREIAWFTKFHLLQPAADHLDGASQPHSVLLLGTRVATDKIRWDPRRTLLNWRDARLQLWNLGDTFNMALMTSEKDSRDYQKIKLSEVIDASLNANQDWRVSHKWPPDFSLRLEIPMSNVFQLNGKMAPQFPLKCESSFLSDLQENVTLNDAYQNIYFSYTNGTIECRTAEVASITEFQGDKVPYVPGESLVGSTQMMIVFEKKNKIPFYVAIRNCGNSCWRK